jgi:precorrin-2 dehydrogenase / sirohydrochlorin ferrochelatase
VLSMNLTLRGMPVLVVGGGTVGRHKAEVAAAAGGVVTVVDPNPRLVPLAAGVRHRVEPFAAEHLDGVRLAFACVTPQVNAAVVAAAKARGVWVCSASDPAGGDFVLPSVARRGELTFAVSTGGASPALAKRLAGELLEQFDDGYAEWVRVLGEVRAAVLANVGDAGERRRLLSEFAHPVWLERIRTAGADVALAEMLGRIDPKSQG